MSVDYQHIEEAADALHALVHPTPLLEFDDLNSRAGGRVFLKAECCQRTGSFKFRGAYNCLRKASRASLRKGAVAWSSGNHAQGVASAGQLFSAPVTVVMPHDTPAIKIAATKALGATIVFYDRYTEDREKIGQAIALETGAVLVPSYDHYDVIAGQGTVGLEVCDQLETLGVVPDTMLICCGGGGLTAGISVAIRHRFAHVGILTVEPEQFDDTARSLASGNYECNSPDARGICDALMTTTPGSLTFPILSESVQRGITVSDNEVLSAMHYAYAQLRLLLEPGGAVALAAVLSGKTDTAGRTTVITLSGGNVTTRMMGRAAAVAY